MNVVPAPLVSNLWHLSSDILKLNNSDGVTIIYCWLSCDFAFNLKLFLTRPEHRTHL